MHATVAFLRCCPVCTKGLQDTLGMPRSSFFTDLSISITNKDHLMQQFAIWTSFWHNLPEYQQQLLDCVILKWHQKLDDRHQKWWHLLPGENHLDHLLYWLYLYPHISLLCNNLQTTPKYSFACKDRELSLSPDISALTNWLYINRNLKSLPQCCFQPVPLFFHVFKLLFTKADNKFSISLHIINCNILYLTECSSFWLAADFLSSIWVFCL